MAQARNGSDVLRQGIANQLLADFNHTTIHGLPRQPIITRTVTSRTPEPYVYVREEDSIEDFVTKTGETRRHTIAIEVCLKYGSMRGTHVQRDQIVDEVIRVCTGEYPDLTNQGFQVFLIDNVEVTTLDPFEERGARYFKAIIYIDYTLCVYINANVQPVQPAIFTYQNWEFTPTSRQLECFDTGLILGAQTYPSSNNGWDFDRVDYALITNADGTLTNNSYNVPSDAETVGVATTIHYVLNSDNSITTRVLDTDEWERIKSIRSGSWFFANDPTPHDPSIVYTFSEADIINLPQWTENDRVVDFGVTNPHNHRVVIQQRLGEHIYIIQDASEPHIIDIRPTAFEDNPTANFISQFDITTVSTDCGDYRLYVRDCPATITGANSLTLFT